MINKMLQRYTDLEIKDFAVILHLKDDFKISENRIALDDWMANRTLSQLNLCEKGIIMQGIDGKDNYYFISLSGEFEILPDDVVTIYGKVDGIKSVYNRKKNYMAILKPQGHIRKEKNRHNAKEPKQKEDKSLK